MTAAPGVRRACFVYTLVAMAASHHDRDGRGPDWSETIAFGTVQVVSSATSLLASGVIGRELGA